MSEASEKRAHAANAKSQPIGTFFITYQEALVKVGDDQWRYVETPQWTPIGDIKIAGVMYAFEHMDPTPFEQWWFS